MASIDEVSEAIGELRALAVAHASDIDGLREDTRAGLEGVRTEIGALANRAVALPETCATGKNLDSQVRALWRTVNAHRRLAWLATGGVALAAALMRL